MNLIIDGTNLAHRARHAYDLSYRGKDTSTTYGVMRMLAALVRNYNPSSVVFAWDGGTPGFRRRLVPEYKSKRKHEEDPTWLEFLAQLGELEKILPYTGVLQVKRRGIEADDIMAHAAQMLTGDNLIITTDDDLLQCVDDATSVFKPGGKKGTIYRMSNFEDKVGWPPFKFVLSKVLQGDSSDNIKGVFGIGPKTAHKLLQHDNVLEAASPKLRDRIEKFIEDGSYVKAYGAIDLSHDRAGARLTILRSKWHPAHVKRLYKWCIDRGFVSIIEQESLSVFGRLREPQFDKLLRRTPLVWDYGRAEH